MPTKAKQARLEDLKQGKTFWAVDVRVDGDSEKPAYKVVGTAQLDCVCKTRYESTGVFWAYEMNNAGQMVRSKEPVVIMLHHYGFPAKGVYKKKAAIDVTTQYCRLFTTYKAAERYADLMLTVAPTLEEVAKFLEAEVEVLENEKLQAETLANMQAGGDITRMTFSGIPMTDIMQTFLDGAASVKALPKSSANVNAE